MFFYLAKLTHPEGEQWMVVVSCIVTVSKVVVQIVGEEYSVGLNP